MERKYWILVAIQTVAIILLFVYAVFQRAHAIRQREQAEIDRAVAIQQRMMADHRTISTEAELSAMRAELDKCRSGQSPRSGNP